MPSKRFGVAASVVNGKIYVFGGQNDDHYGEGVTRNALNTVEEYDPTTDTWIPKAPMPTARMDLASTAYNGKIYVFGGEKGWGANGYGFGFSNAVEAYDPSTDTWTTKASMNTPRSGLASSVLDGKIYVLGLVDDTGINSNIAEVYTPSTDTWETIASMNNGHAHPASSVVNGQVYIFGGLDGPLPMLKTDPFIAFSVEAYNISTNTWVTKSSIPNGGRASLASSAVNGKVYLLGGGFATEALEYDAIGDAWTSRAPMPTTRSQLASCEVNGKIYVFGGATDYSGWPMKGAVDTVEEYTPPAYTPTINQVLVTVNFVSNPGVPIPSINVFIFYNVKDNGQLKTYETSLNATGVLTFNYAITKDDLLQVFVSCPEYLGRFLGFIISGDRNIFQTVTMDAAPYKLSGRILDQGGRPQPHVLISSVLSNQFAMLIMPTQDCSINVGVGYSSITGSYSIPIAIGSWNILVRTSITGDVLLATNLVVSSSINNFDLIVPSGYVPPTEDVIVPTMDFQVGTIYTVTLNVGDGFSFSKNTVTNNEFDLQYTYSSYGYGLGVQGLTNNSIFNPADFNEGYLSSLAKIWFDASSIHGGVGFGANIGPHIVRDTQLNYFAIDIISENASVLVFNWVALANSGNVWSSSPTLSIVFSPVTLNIKVVNSSGTAITGAGLVGNLMTLENNKLVMQGFQYSGSTGVDGFFVLTRNLANEPNQKLSIQMWPTLSYVGKNRIVPLPNDIPPVFIVTANDAPYVVTGNCFPITGNILQGLPDGMFSVMSQFFSQYITSDLDAINVDFGNAPIDSLGNYSIQLSPETWALAVFGAPIANQYNFITRNLVIGSAITPTPTIKQVLVTVNVVDEFGLPLSGVRYAYYLQGPNWTSIEKQGHQTDASGISTFNFMTTLNYGLLSFNAALPSANGSIVFQQYWAISSDRQIEQTITLQTRIEKVVTGQVEVNLPAGSVLTAMSISDSILVQNFYGTISTNFTWNETRPDFGFQMYTVLIPTSGIYVLGIPVGEWILALSSPKYDTLQLVSSSVIITPTIIPSLPTANFQVGTIYTVTLNMGEGFNFKDARIVTDNQFDLKVFYSDYYKGPVLSGWRATPQGGTFYSPSAFDGQVTSLTDLVFDGSTIVDQTSQGIEVPPVGSISIVAVSGNRYVAIETVTSNGQTVVLNWTPLVQTGNYWTSSPNHTYIFETSVLNLRIVNEIGEPTANVGVMFMMISTASLQNMSPTFRMTNEKGEVTFAKQFVRGYDHNIGWLSVNPQSFRQVNLGVPISSNHTYTYTVTYNTAAFEVLGNIAPVTYAQVSQNTMFGIKGVVYAMKESIWAKYQNAFSSFNFPDTSKVEYELNISLIRENGDYSLSLSDGTWGLAIYGYPTSNEFYFLTRNVTVGTFVSVPAPPTEGVIVPTTSPQVFSKPDPVNMATLNVTVPSFAFTEPIQLIVTGSSVVSYSLNALPSTDPNTGRSFASASFLYGFDIQAQPITAMVGLTTNIKPTINAPIELSIELSANILDTTSIRVFYFDPLLSRWATEGISIKGVLNNRVTFTTTHFTYFGIAHVQLVSNRVNHPPIISMNSVISVNEASTITLNPTLSDPDGDTINVIYSGWMTSNVRQTGYSDAGTFNELITATDSLGGVTTKAITIVVNNVNRLPVVVVNTANMVRVGNTLTLNPSITDLDDISGNRIVVTYSGWMNANAKTASDGDVSSSQKVYLNVNDGDGGIVKVTLNVLIYGTQNILVDQSTYPQSVFGKRDSNWNTELGLLADTFKKRFIDPYSGKLVYDPVNLATSQGTSYGLMMFLWTNKQTDFDALWSAAKTKQQHSADKLFSSKATSDGTIISTTALMDGCEDIALALIFAETMKRTGMWGNTETDYGAEARNIVSDIYTLATDQTNGLYPDNLKTADFNPSYFAPAAYRIFAQFDGSPTHNWNTIIEKGYTSLLANPVAGYGLAPDWSNFNGTVPSSKGRTSGYSAGSKNGSDVWVDAIRVSWRMALDSLWNKDNRAQSFVLSENWISPTTAYLYKIDRTPYLYSLNAYNQALPVSMWGAGAAGTFVTVRRDAFMDQLASFYQCDATGPYFSYSKQDANNAYLQSLAWFGMAVMNGAIVDVYSDLGTTPNIISINIQSFKAGISNNFNLIIRDDDGWQNIRTVTVDIEHSSGKRIQYAYGNVISNRTLGVNNLGLFVSRNWGYEKVDDQSIRLTGMAQFICSQNLFNIGPLTLNVSVVDVQNHPYSVSLTVDYVSMQPTGTFIIKDNAIQSTRSITSNGVITDDYVVSHKVTLHVMNAFAPAGIKYYQWDISDGTTLKTAPTQNIMDFTFTSSINQEVYITLSMVDEFDAVRTVGKEAWISPLKINRISVNADSLVTNKKRMMVTIDVQGIDSMQLSGDLREISVNEWIAYESNPTLTLTEGGGTKDIWITFRDRKGVIQRVDKRMTYVPVAPLMQAHQQSYRYVQWGGTASIDVTIINTANLDFGRPTVSVRLRYDNGTVEETPVAISNNHVFFERLATDNEGYLTIDILHATNEDDISAGFYDVARFKFDYTAPQGMVWNVVTHTFVLTYSVEVSIDEACEVELTLNSARLQGLSGETSFVVEPAISSESSKIQVVLDQGANSLELFYKDLAGNLGQIISSDVFVGDKTMVFAVSTNTDSTQNATVEVSFPVGALSRNIEAMVNVVDNSGGVSTNADVFEIRAMDSFKQELIQHVAFDLPVVIKLPFYGTTVDHQIFLKYLDTTVSPNRWRTDGLRIISIDVQNQYLVAEVMHFTPFGVVVYSDSHPPIIGDIKLNDILLSSGGYINNLPDFRIRVMETNPSDSGITSYNFTLRKVDSSDVRIVTGDLSGYAAVVDTWLTFNITGTPLSEGNYTLTILVADDAGNATAFNRTLQVKGNVDIVKFLMAPNPVNINQEPVHIVYTLTTGADVKVMIYDMAGKLIKKWELSTDAIGAAAGKNDLSWNGIGDDGSKVRAGVYPTYLIAESGGKRQMRKFNLMVYK